MTQLHHLVTSFGSHRYVQYIICKQYIRLNICIYKMHANVPLCHLLFTDTLEWCFCIGCGCGWTEQWFMPGKQRLCSLTLNLGLEVDVFSNRHIYDSSTWKLQSEHEGVVVHLGLWHQHTIVIVESCHENVNTQVCCVTRSPNNQVNMCKKNCGL